MAETTKIAWADATWNPWIGCTRVSPACDLCYAEKLATSRLGVGWGPHAERHRTAEGNWRQPVRWDRKAGLEGRRRRVFCASLADFFDNAVPPAWRVDAWEVIRMTANLDWMLLTKRPQNVRRMMPGERLWPNVWLGATAENQAELERRSAALLRVPATVHFLSCEPLLEPIHDIPEGIDWVICGGESGPGARPMRRQWVEHLMAECVARGIAFFFKQAGSAADPAEWGGISGKGDSPSEWPAELRLQQFPRIT